MKVKFLYLLLLTTLIWSCQEDGVYTNTKSEINEIMEFTYNDITYLSSFYHSDSLLVFEDKEVGNLYNKLIKNPSLATLITNEGKIYYFDSYESQQEYLSEILPLTNNSSDVSTRASETGRCFLQLYEHDNYRGRLQEFRTTGDLNINDLSAYNFENVMTSFKLISGNGHYSVTFFRNLNYEGATITFWTNPSYYWEEPNMGKFNCSSHRTWNDQLSSFKLTKW